MMFLVLALSCFDDSPYLSSEGFLKQEHMAEYFNVLLSGEETASFEINTLVNVEDVLNSSCRIWLRLYHVNFGDAGVVALQLDDQRAEIDLQAMPNEAAESDTQTALRWQIPEGNYDNRLDIPCEDGVHTIQMSQDVDHEVLYSIDFVGSIYGDITENTSIQTAVKIVE